ncbi:MAG: imidazolonepropionase [Thermoanaerobaculia bacterium]|nr:imidazolonepropionase [Thermoanaerobaculia bacterium]
MASGRSEGGWDAPPWDGLWVGGNLATMAGPEEYGTIEDGALAVEDGEVAWVGPQGNLPGKPEDLAATVHPVSGAWILPGLVDCHTHLVWAGSRADEFEQRLQGVSYEEIARRGGGILSTVRATREAPEEGLLEAAGRRLQRLLEEGVTTVEIKSGYGLEPETEVKMLRAVRALGDRHPVQVVSTFLGAHAVPPEYREDPDGYVELVCREMIPTVAEAGLADAVDGFCETIAFSVEQMDRVFDAAAEHGLPVKLHAEQLTNLGGAELVARHEGLSADHLEHLDEDGVAAMAEAGTVAVLLPGAFYTLRETQVPPVELLRRHEVPMALATDWNPGSSPLGSLLWMLNLACTLFRLTPGEALAGVTREAARALGLSDRGTLEIGKRADFSVWEVERPAALAYEPATHRPVEIVRGGAPTTGPSLS